MKKLFFSIVVFLVLCSGAWADGNYEAVTIDNTAGGVGLTAATYGRARSALCRLETASIRYTLDGTNAPTADVGVFLAPLEWIILENPGQIKNFKGFRTGGTSGSLKCFYFD